MWENNDWLYEGQHGFRTGYSCESQVITVCQDISDPPDNGDKIYAILVGFRNSFDLDPHGRLLTKISNSRVDSMVVVWISEFHLGCPQRVRVGRQLSEEVRVMSGVPQGSILGPLLFLSYVNDIWRNVESIVRRFADDCVICRNIINNENMDNL